MSEDKIIKDELEKFMKAANILIENERAKNKPLKDYLVNKMKDKIKEIEVKEKNK